VQLIEQVLLSLLGLRFIVCSGVLRGSLFWHVSSEGFHARRGRTVSCNELA
jgi:hypothetical protein